MEIIFANFMGGKSLKTINNHSLRTFILALKKKDKGRTISNYGGWQSNDLSLEEDVLKDLLIEIKKNLVPFERALRLRKEFKLKVKLLWANVNGMGGINLPHIHNQSVLSGVYYVTRPKNSGNLRLMNPNLFNHISLAFMGRMETFSEGPTPFTGDQIEVTGTEGTLIIFPSHLCHFVLPNLSKEERISISFNINLVKEVEEGQPQEKN